MRFNLYRCQLQQAPRTTTCHLVAASQEHAAIIMDQHIDALGLGQVSYSLERVDQTLPESWGGGELEDILENAPAGLVSYTEIGWVAHTAPVHRLRLFTAQDHLGRAARICPGPHRAAALGHVPRRSGRCPRNRQ